MAAQKRPTEAAGAMAEPSTSRTTSERPILIGLAIQGGVYVVLIVGMLAADLLYLVVHKQTGLLVWPWHCYRYQQLPAVRHVAADL